MKPILDLVKEWQLVLTGLWSNAFVRSSVIIVLIVGTLIYMPYRFDAMDRSEVRAGFFFTLLFIFFAQLKGRETGQSFLLYFYNHFLGFYLGLWVYYWLCQIWHQEGLDDYFRSVLSLLKQIPKIDWFSDLNYEGNLFPKGKLNFLTTFLAVLSQVVMNMTYMKLSKPHQKTGDAK